MAVETVFLLPGQGGYTPGIFAGESSPAVAEVLRTVDRVAAEFGRAGISGLLTRTDAPGAAELVRSDSFALQLAVFAAGVGGYRLAVARDGAPDVVVGHSMGEIAALTVAGAFELADGARLVCHRSEALLAHCPTPGGMVALELSQARAAHLVGAVAERGLAVAVTNAPRQTVVSGPDEAVAVVARLAEALGVQATRLNAPFPFHSPVLAAAAHEFGGAIGGIRQLPLRMAVYSPVAGGYVGDDTDLKALLVRQLTDPVRFLDALRELHAQGAEQFVECGKAGLSGLVRRSVPGIATGPARAAQAAPVVAPVAAPVVEEPVAAVPDSAEVLARLRELYASTLGYPVEMVTADADLEADLGIDSLKRAEMLAKVTAHFALGETAETGRFIAQSTLADLAGLIVVALGNSPVAPVVAPAAPVGEVPDSSEVLAQLRELYASTLGYPVEMVTADADLEADLGIDSLKRAEMLAKVTAHFGLGETAETGRFIAQSTLADLSELIVAARASAR